MTSALKAAETDATKRALVTFGKAFGLALYAHRGGKQDRTAGRATSCLRTWRKTVAAEAEAPALESGRRWHAEPAAATSENAIHRLTQRTNGATPPSDTSTPIADTDRAYPSIRLRVAPQTGSTRALLPLGSRAGFATRPTSAMSARSPAFFAARVPPIPIISALPKCARSAERSATSSPFRSAGNTTARSTTAATRRRGGTIWGSTRSRSPASFGKRPAGSR